MANCTYLSANQIANILEQAGWPSNLIPTGVAIALAESSGYTCSANISNIETSYGLFQINTKANPQYGSYDLYDPYTNAKVALEMANQYGFTPWSTYTSGVYQKYLPQGYAGAQNPLPAGFGGSNTPNTTLLGIPNPISPMTDAIGNFFKTIEILANPKQLGQAFVQALEIVGMYAFAIIIALVLIILGLYRLVTGKSEKIIVKDTIKLARRK